MLRAAILRALAQVDARFRGGRSTLCLGDSESGRFCPQAEEPRNCDQCRPKAVSRNVGVGFAGSLTGTCSSLAVTMPCCGYRYSHQNW